MIQNTYHGSKHSILAIKVVRIETWWSWIISPANVKSLFKINSGHKIFICGRIFEIFAGHVTRNLVPIFGIEIIYPCLSFLQVIPKQALSEDKKRTLSKFSRLNIFRKQE